MNQINLLGFVGGDAKMSEKGDCLQFSLATNESWKDKNDEWQKSTDWHFCKIYGNKKDFLVDRVKKGTRILVTGKQCHNSYEEEPGKKESIKTFSFVKVKNITVVEGKDNAIVLTTEDIPF